MVIGFGLKKPGQAKPIPKTPAPASKRTAEDKDEERMNIPRAFAVSRPPLRRPKLIQTHVRDDDLAAGVGIGVDDAFQP